MTYCKQSPCNNCPYRKDAPLQHWSIEEFRDLLKKDKDYFGATYGCHKNDGTMCTGFVMNQDKRNIPSINLRISFSKNRITTKFLDSLKCKSEMFQTIEEMSIANYPELEIKTYENSSKNNPRNPHPPEHRQVPGKDQGEVHKNS